MLSIYNGLQSSAGHGVPIFPPFQSYTIKTFIHQSLHFPQCEPVIVIPNIALYLCPCHFYWVEFTMSNWKPDYLMIYAKIPTFMHITFLLTRLGLTSLRSSFIDDINGALGFVSLHYLPQLAL